MRKSADIFTAHAARLVRRVKYVYCGPCISFAKRNRFAPVAILDGLQLLALFLQSRVHAVDIARH
jgi:hypothetical protein